MKLDCSVFFRKMKLPQSLTPHKPALDFSNINHIISMMMRVFVIFLLLTTLSVSAGNESVDNRSEEKIVMDMEKAWKRETLKATKIGMEHTMSLYTKLGRRLAVTGVTLFGSGAAIEIIHHPKTGLFIAGVGVGVGISGCALAFGSYFYRIESKQK